jgi:hypothetical protein
LENRCLLSITVNTLVDEADGSITDGDVSLRDAIALVPVGQTIDFAPALTSSGSATINLTLDELLINKSLTINGPGADLLTIKAFDPTPATTNGDGSRIFNIDDGTDAVRTVSISGLTLTGGDVTGQGGAIFSKELLTVTSSKITGNRSSASPISVLFGIAGGGGIYSGGTLNVTSSTISGNFSADDGGGISSSGNTTVVGSTLSGNTAGSAGGGIRHAGGTLTIADSHISGNSTRGGLRTYGGGIYSVGNLTLSRSTVTGNTAGFWENVYVNGGGYGGGIYSLGSLTIAESSIRGNTSIAAWTVWGPEPFVAHGGIGGGISHVLGAATITRSEVSNNHAGWQGGGISHYFGSLSVTESTISGNLADFQGGGIYSTSGYASRSTTNLSVNRSTISGNTTDESGGGIWSRGASLTVSSSTISSNRTQSFDFTSGGGIYSDNLTATVSHSTISRNSTGGNGGGIRSLGNMAISHTIVAGNTHGVVSVPDDVSGSVEVSLSLLGVDTGATIIDNGGNLIGTAAAPIDPLLGPLADYGGPTLPDGSKMLTHSLLAGSPAIDAVDAAAVAGMTGNVVSENLGSSAYSASQWAEWSPGAAPGFAFDGNVAAGWDAGNYPIPVQWLEVDLQHPQTLTGFRLYVDQLPGGETIHEVWVSNSPIQNNLTGATLIHTFAGFTADQDVLTFELPSAVAARFVQIRTTESPSWVGWDEVQVFAGDVPLFDQRGAPFGRGFGDRIDIGAFESQPMPPAFYGDYNQNSVVDAADYTVWRDRLGSNPSPYSGADGSGNGVVDAADYDLWRAHFGQVVPASGAGSGSFASESLVSMVAQQPPALPGDGAAELLTVARAETNFPADPAPGRTGGRVPAGVSAAEPIAQPLRTSGEDERATQRENPPPALAASSPIVPHRPVNRSLRAAARAPAVAARDAGLLAWLASLTGAVPNNGAAEMERPSTRSVVESLDEGSKGVLDAAFGIFDGHEGAGRGRHW